MSATADCAQSLAPERGTSHLDTSRLLTAIITQTRPTSTLVTTIAICVHQEQPKSGSVARALITQHQHRPSQPPNLRSDNGISRNPTASLSLGGRLVRTARDARILAPPPLAAAAPGSKWVPCSRLIASCACPASANDTNALVCACVLVCVRATARPPSGAAAHPCVHVCVSCSEHAHVSRRRACATIGQTGQQTSHCGDSWA